MTADLEALREEWKTQRPLYQDFAREVGSMLEKGARKRSIPCEVKHRAKEVHKLVGKALRKRYADPDREIRDKAGARAIVTYTSDVQQIERLVRETFTVEHYENKITTLDYDELGYLGVHFEVRLPEPLLGGESSRFRDLVCEIQVQTRAQSLWAEVSHALCYKPALGPPVAVLRGIYRLVALVEIFDEAVTHAGDVILGMAGLTEAKMLQDLERNFRRFSARDFDRELSMHVLSSLQGLLLPEEVANFGRAIDEFVGSHEEKLNEIFEDYREDERNPFLLQPEALLIFRCLERDRFRLAERWSAVFPPSLLERLATVWGTSLE